MACASAAGEPQSLTHDHADVAIHLDHTGFLGICRLLVSYQGSFTRDLVIERYVAFVFEAFPIKSRDPSSITP